MISRKTWTGVLTLCLLMLASCTHLSDRSTSPKVRANPTQLTTAPTPDTSDPIASGPIASGPITPDPITFGPIKGVTSGAYTLDKTHAFLSASLSHWGLSMYKIHFTDFDAALSFNAVRPDASTISLKLNPAGLETFFPQGSKRDAWQEKLKFGKKFLDGARHPNIEFTSTDVVRTGESTGQVTGQLTLRGISKPVTADIIFNGARAFPWAPRRKVLGFEAIIKFNRADFGLTTLLPHIGDEVTVEFTGEFRQK